MNSRDYHLNSKENQNILIMEFNLFKSYEIMKLEINITQKSKIFNKNEEKCKCKYKKHYNIIKNLFSGRRIRLLINHIILALCLFVSILSTKFEDIKIQFNDSYILLQIKGYGNYFQIINFNNIIPPDEIYINEINKTEIKNEYYYINNPNSTIKLVWKENINSTFNMFRACNQISAIDLSHFDSSQVNNMANMFYGCANLASLNLNDMNTSQVTNMNSMFYQCDKLALINLSSFDTSKVSLMNSMFLGCINIKVLDLSSFNTSNVLEMGSMFFGCKHLEMLNLSNFDTSKVITMNSMFRDCTSLTVLDLSNFNISNVNEIRFMFLGCSSLIYLNLSSFKYSKAHSLNSVF